MPPKKTKSQDQTNDESFLDLDLLRLDRHWLEQPRLVYQYGRLLAEAQAEYDELKALNAVAEAETRDDMARNPDDYDLQKTTEAALSAAVLCQKPIIDRTKKLIKLKHRVDVLRATMNTLEHRKKALEDLVKLHGQSYFASPQADADGDEYLEENRRQSVRKRTQGTSRKTKGNA